MPKNPLKFLRQTGALPLAISMQVAFKLGNGLAQGQVSPVFRDLVLRGVQLYFIEGGGFPPGRLL